MTIREHVQRSSLGTPVTLYELDLTPFGMDLLRMCPTSYRNSAVSFGGEEYAPHPIRAEGFEMTSAGSLPRPSFIVGNLDNSFTALVEQNDDLHGAILTRLRTFDRYLEDGPEPDGAAIKPPDVYQLSQLTDNSETQIGWICSALMDQQGQELPNRQIVRDYCGWETRRWNPLTAAFEYTHAECPYTGDPLDEDGNPCAPVDEVFSKRLTTCCQARFGVNAVLPTGAFPGVARLRSR